MNEPASSPPNGPLASPEDEDARKKMMRENGRSLKHIGEARLMAVIAASVRHAVKRTFGEVREETLDKAAGIAQRGFLHLLKNNGQSVRGLPVSDFVKEVEAERRKILAQREKALAELNRLTVELEQRRDEMSQEREEFIREREVSGAKLDDELVGRIQELFAGMEGAEGIEELQDAVTRIALGTVQEERDKAVEEKLANHEEEVANYERRIAKLTQSLDRTEEEIRRLAQMKDVESGVASIYRTVQGISGDDESAESKKEMMTAIFEANLALRDQVAA